MNRKDIIDKLYRAQNIAQITGDCTIDRELIKATILLISELIEENDLLHQTLSENVDVFENDFDRGLACQVED